MDMLSWGEDVDWAVHGRRRKLDENLGENLGENHFRTRRSLLVRRSRVAFDYEQRQIPRIR